MQIFCGPYHICSLDCLSNEQLHKYTFSVSNGRSFKKRICRSCPWQWPWGWVHLKVGSKESRACDLQSKSVCGVRCVALRYTLHVLRERRMVRFFCWLIGLCVDEWSSSNESLYNVWYNVRFHYAPGRGEEKGGRATRSDERREVGGGVSEMGRRQAGGGETVQE